MKKFFRRVLKGLVVLMVVLGLCMLGVFIFVDPNQFKGPIEQWASKQYGQTLSIQGPLNWSWSPLLALELHEVALENAAPFKDKMLSAKSIRTELGLVSLLAGKVSVSLKLEGVKLALERNSKGEENWVSLLGKIKNSGDSKANVQETNRTTAVESSSSLGSKTILVTGLKIEDAEISFRDQQKNKHYILDHLNFSAQDVIQGFLGKASPVTLSFNLGEGARQKSSQFLAQFSWTFSPLKEELTVQELVLKMTASAGQSMKLNGEAKVLKVGSQPVVQGKLQGHNLDIKPWLEDWGIQYNPAMPTAGDLSASFQYASPYFSLNTFKLELKDNGSLTGTLKADLSRGSAQTATLEGDFQGRALLWGKIKLDEIKGTVRAKEGLVNISPLVIQVANSIQNCSLLIDFRGKSPKYTFSQIGRGFDIRNLVLLFGDKDKLQGKADLKISLTTMGDNLNELRNNLSGQAELDIRDGQLHGVDLNGLLKNAQSSLHSLVGGVKNLSADQLGKSLNSAQIVWDQKNSNPNAITAFTQLKVLANINQGMVQKSSLAINHPDYNVNGEGSLNLANLGIHYQVSVLYKGNAYPANDDFGQYLQSMALPVRIEGTIQDPKVRPDFKAYSNNAMAYVQKKVVQDVIQDKVQKNVEKVMGDTLNRFLDQVKGG